MHQPHQGSTQPHQGLIEKLLRYANTYTNLYNQPIECGFPVSLSPSQLQTLEYVLSGENQKMAQIAARLGITRGTFSKNVSKLLEKGILIKEKRAGNQKDVFVRVSPLGREIYEGYSRYMETTWYQHMVSIAEDIPAVHRARFEAMLEGFTLALENETLEKKMKFAAE